MTSRVNAPHWQSGPLAWALVSGVLTLLVLTQTLRSQVGSERWWGGLLLVGCGLFAFAFVEGIWLYAQREVAFSGGRIVIRRWAETLVGRPGVEVPLDTETKCTITRERGRHLTIERGNTIAVSMQLVYWEVDTVVELVAAFRQFGAEIATPWNGDHP